MNAPVKIEAYPLPNGDITKLGLSTRALGHLEDHPTRVLRKGGRGIVEMFIHQIGRVHIDEDLTGSIADLRGDAIADGTAQLGQPAQALGGADEVGRPGEERLRGADERLVAEEGALRPADDGLERHP